MSSGTITVPPPTPNRALNTPAAVAMTPSFSRRSRGIGGDTSSRAGSDRSGAVTTAGRDSIEATLAPLRDAPNTSAVLCDLDGTLAPIVSDPASVAVPAEARELIALLCRRYALVGCVTGRRALDARRIVGVDE